MAETTYTVSGIHCSRCAANIESGLRRLDGVRHVRADPEARTVTVRYDERRVDEPAIGGQLARLGFEPARRGR